MTVQRAAVSDTEDALVNLPLGRGDRVVTAADGRAEITLDDGTTVWLDVRSSLDFLSLPSAGASGEMIVRLWAGSLYVDRPRPATGRLAPLRIDAPNGTVMLDRDGLFRIDLDEDQGVWLSVYDGAASLTAGGITEVVGAGQRSLAEAGTAPALAAAFNTVGTDDFDGWRAERVAFYAESHQYVRDRDYIPRTIVHHAADLEPYGSWAYDTGLSSWYWKPYAAIAWTPYRYGRWVYTYGGWSWVPSAPWGYVTTHYGRWHHTSYNGWAWFPGSIWAHASVHWYIGSHHVGWVPLNYYGRPAVTFGVHFGGRSRFSTYDYGRRGISVGKTGSAFGGRTVNGFGYRAGPDAWTVVPQESFGTANTARRAIARGALPTDLNGSSRVLLSGPLRARDPRGLAPAGRTAVSRDEYRSRGTARPGNASTTGTVRSTTSTTVRSAVRRAQPRATPWSTFETDHGATPHGDADAHCPAVIVVYPVADLRQALDPIGDFPDCQPGTTLEVGKTVGAPCACSSAAHGGGTTTVLACSTNGAPQSFRFAVIRQPPFRKPSLVSPSIGPPAFGFGPLAVGRPHGASTSRREAARRI